MKLIFICSPYRGDIETNVAKAQKLANLIVSHRLVPIAPHLYFTQFLDDSSEEQRAAGIKAGLKLLTLCDEVWVYEHTGVITEGMRQEIDLAEILGKPIKYFKELSKSPLQDILINQRRLAVELYEKEKSE